MRSELKSPLACLAAVAAVAAALAWPCAPRVDAQSQSGGKQKVSADLWEKSHSGGRVNVLIAAAGRWGAPLERAVAAGGGTVTRSYANFDVRAATLPAAAAAALANRADVAYVSLDREVKSLGHVTMTTGADFARAGGYQLVYAGTGLSGGKKYYYRVRAYNANGNSAYTAVVSATTPTK